MLRIMFSSGITDGNINNGAPAVVLMAMGKYSALKSI